MRTQQKPSNLALYINNLSGKDDLGKALNGGKSSFA